MTIEESPVEQYLCRLCHKCSVLPFFFFLNYYEEIVTFIYEEDKYNTSWELNLTQSYLAFDWYIIILFTLHLRQSLTTKFVVESISLTLLFISKI